jgi:hypothetical protein
MMMADQPQQTNSTPAAPTTAQPASTPAPAPVTPGAAAPTTPATPTGVAPTLLAADPAKPADPAATPAEPAPEAMTREKFDALSPSKQVEAWKELNEEQRKTLGIEAEPTATYKDFKVPDGVTLDADSLKAASDMFAESGLNQTQAQKFIDMAIAREQAAMERSVQVYRDIQTKWQGEVKSDPEIGGDKLEASLASARRAMDRLNIPGLNEALDVTGAGNHPAVVKAFVRLGQMVSEDRFVPGNSAAPASLSPAVAIYGTSGPKQSADG